MFDNLMNTLTKQTNNLSDLVKTKARKLSVNLNLIKERIVHNTKKPIYTEVTLRDPHEEAEYLDSYLSPRAYSMTTYSIDYNSVNENMEWFPYVPPSYDEQNIVDRFLRVITVNDDILNVKIII